jgi:hypothetical protein
LIQVRGCAWDLGRHRKAPTAHAGLARPAPWKGNRLHDRGGHTSRLWPNQTSGGAWNEPVGPHARRLCPCTWGHLGATQPPDTAANAKPAWDPKLALQSENQCSRKQPQGLKGTSNRLGRRFESCRACRSGCHRIPSTHRGLGHPIKPRPAPQLAGPRTGSHPSALGSWPRPRDFEGSKVRCRGRWRIRWLPGRSKRRRRRPTACRTA